MADDDADTPPISSSASVNVSAHEIYNVFNDKAQLWQFVKKIKKTSQARGCWKWQCTFCKLNFQGSYTRVKYHLLKEANLVGVAYCSKVNSQAHTQMIKIVRDCNERQSNAAPRQVPLPSSSRGQGQGSSSTGCYGMTFSTSCDPKKRKGGSGPLHKAFNNEARAQCDEEVGRMFYTGGLSFNLARNPHYRESYRRASTLPGYTPPGYNKLRTTLLAREKKNIEHHLEPIKMTWPTKGVSLCSNGWSDPQRRSIINVLAVNQTGAMMLKAVNCEGEFKDHKLVASLIIESIKQVGYQNVVQVVTDNAPVYSKAGKLIETQYPTIFWTPCVVHTLNLVVNNICAPTLPSSHSDATQDVYDACSWIMPVSDDVVFIRNFIMNHGMRLVMFSEHCDLRLLSIAPTRFASTIVMMLRFKKIKNGLQQMVISPKWEDYRADDYHKAELVKVKQFWDDIEYILTFAGLIHEMIRKADTDKPSLHLVYEWWNSMIERIKHAIYRKERKQLHESSEFWNAVESVLIARWTKSYTSLHCLAHSLNPKYYSFEWLQEDNSRVAPNNDQENKLLAPNTYTEQYKFSFLRARKTCIARYFSNPEDRRKVAIEFADFFNCTNGLSDGDAIRDRYHMEPVTWWSVHGASVPTIQHLAYKLLGQPSSSSCCERNWSTYSFIHSLARNKLTPQRAEDLVFVHTNLRLLAMRHPSYTEGVTQQWDLGGDEMDSLNVSNVGVLKIAQLSFDEPDLEAMIFNVDEDEDEEIDLENA